MSDTAAAPATDAAPADAAKSGFSPVVMAALLIVGLIATVAFFAGNAFDSGPRLDFDGRAHAASKSAVGFAGAVELLKDVGHPVVVARGPVTSSGSVLIVTPDDGVEGSIFDVPVVQNHDGPVLVVLPKWETMPSGRINWVRKLGLRRDPIDDWLKAPKDPADEDLGGEGAGEPEPVPPPARPDRKALEQVLKKMTPPPVDPNHVSLGHGPSGRHNLSIVSPQGNLPAPLTATGPIESLQTFRYTPGWTPLVVDASGAPVLITSEDEYLYVLSEPDLLNTQGLASIDNARAMVALLDDTFGPDASYVFDVTLHGIERSRSFVRQAFEPPFLAATLCALAAIGLMAWHAFVRFGRAARGERAFASGKRALADNQADLIKMTGREHRMGAPYGGLIRDLAARAVGAPRDLPPEAVDELLDRLGDGGRTSWPLSTLRRDIEQAKDPAELVKTAERLHRWRQEITGEG